MEPILFTGEPIPFNYKKYKIHINGQLEIFICDEQMSMVRDDYEYEAALENILENKLHLEVRKSRYSSYSVVCNLHKLSINTIITYLINNDFCMIDVTGKEIKI